MLNHFRIPELTTASTLINTLNHHFKQLTKTMYMYLMFPCHSILTRCQFMYSRKGPWTLDAGTNLMRLFMRSQLRTMPTRRKKHKEIDEIDVRE